MQQLSKSNSRNRSSTASLLAREVAELHREKAELLEVNARLQKGLEFLLDRYSPPSACHTCRFSCAQDEQ